VALSNIDYSVLKVATGLLEKITIPVQLIQHGVSGNVVVIDIDNPVGKTFYDQYHASRAHKLILLTEHNFHDTRHLVLCKPMRVQTVKDVLHDLYTDMLPRKKNTLTSLSDTSSENFKPLELLFFILLKAFETKETVQIFCHPYSPLFVQTEKNMVAVSSRETLRKIIHSTTPIKSTKIASSDFEILARGQMIVPFKNVLWSAALYGSQGHLIPTHSPDIPVRLKAWPNLSRLDFESEHMKLASLMAGQPVTIRELVARTKLPWSTVVGFYNAVTIMNLVLINPNSAPKHVVQAEPEKMGLFSKIARRLKLAI
jgi:hypothetical protein